MLYNDNVKNNNVKNNKIPLGEMIGESLQNKIESISAFIFLNITVV